MTYKNILTKSCFLFENILRSS